MLQLFFAAANVATSAHMLVIPPLWRIRLSCFFQHAVTLLSVLLALDYKVPFFTGMMACGTFGIGMLFTGLLVAYAGLKKDKNPVSRLPLTPIRIIRNVWSHYGSCAVLWWMVTQEELKITYNHQFAANAMGLCWLLIFGGRAKEIYDVPHDVDLIKDRVLPIMVGSMVLFNIVLWYIRG
jgi:hypothetical protein|tara:strand:+ start:89 stop:628 length:540 start_codon:yes stop_codon:yes gene_type:complete